MRYSKFMTSMRAKQLFAISGIAKRRWPLTCERAKPRLARGAAAAPPPPLASRRSAKTAGIPTSRETSTRNPPTTTWHAVPGFRFAQLSLRATNQPKGNL
jgi:hypothetical protein